VGQAETLRRIAHAIHCQCGNTLRDFFQAIPDDIYTSKYQVDGVDMRGGLLTAIDRLVTPNRWLVWGAFPKSWSSSGDVSAATEAGDLARRPMAGGQHAGEGNRLTTRPADEVRRLLSWSLPQIATGTNCNCCERGAVNPPRTWTSKSSALAITELRSDRPKMAFASYALALCDAALPDNLRPGGAELRLVAISYRPPFEDGYRQRVHFCLIRGDISSRAMVRNSKRRACRR